MPPRRRPAAAPPVRRRPGAAPAAIVVDETIEEKFNKGEKVEAIQLPLGLLIRGLEVITEEGDYFGETVQACGTLDRVVLDGPSVELEVNLKGTSSESILKFITASPDKKFRWHLCGPSCDQRRTNPNLLHTRFLSKLLSTVELTWHHNLIVEDEVAELRARQAEWEKKQEVAKEGGESSSSQGRKSKKKKKSKEGEKKKKKEKEERKLGGRGNSRKTLEALYKNTGLDPEVRTRKKLAKLVKKRLKQSKESSSSSSTGSSSESEVGNLGEDLLHDRSKVQRVARLGPGLLAATAVQAMKPFVVQTQGSTWEQDEDSIPPILSQYVRSYLGPRSSGGILREVTTLAFVGDLLLMARPAEALDCIGQRLKSLEQSIGGVPWSTSQKLEIVPPSEATISSRGELQLAQREAKLDWKTKTPGTSWEKGSQNKSKGKGKDKSKDRDKGKGKAKEEGRKTG